jgi:hypothetical protein
LRTSRSLSGCSVFEGEPCSNAWQSVSVTTRRRSQAFCGNNNFNFETDLHEPTKCADRSGCAVFRFRFFTGELRSRRYSDGRSGLLAEGDALGAGRGGSIGIGSGDRVPITSDERVASYRLRRSNVMVGPTPAFFHHAGSSPQRWILERASVAHHAAIEALAAL